jgi:TatD DNase family protein
MLDAVGDAKQWREVVFCGLGEPTLRLYEVLETARELRHRGAKVRLNTDGLANLVHARDVTADFEGSFDALSVSLNAQNEALYNTHCRPALPGAYDAAQEFVRRVREFVPRVTVTAIDGLPGIDVPACEARAKELGAGFRRRVLGRVG